jgi:hypothetical protein
MRFIYYVYYLILVFINLKKRKILKILKGQKLIEKDTYYTKIWLLGKILC